MKVTFVSNYLSPHQIPFCNAMYDQLGNDFRFISTVPINQDRIKLGWKESVHTEYEIRSYQSNSQMKQVRDLVDNSEIVIIGSAPDKLVEKRLKQNKVTFKYSERLYKQGLSIVDLPKATISAYIHHGKFQKYPLFMLCASAYTASDVSIFGNYKGRTFKWGYFPYYVDYDIKTLMKKKQQNVVKILWVGRFLDWKHPELALVIAKRLKRENIPFQLKMVGTGDILEDIKNSASDLGLINSIEFVGAVPYELVREYMDEANIFLFTSDFNEGWGAVLNEAMNSGCAVVASHAIGAVPFLLKHRENGLIYQNGNTEDLCEKVVTLAKDRNLCESLGEKAYYTIRDTWNAEVAATRFLDLSESILNGFMKEYADGPCSKAEILENDWFKVGE